MNGAAAPADLWGVQFESGDRLEVDLDAAARDLIVPAMAAAIVSSTTTIEDQAGRVLETVADVAFGRIHIPALSLPQHPKFDSVWLEWRGEGRFALTFLPATEMEAVESADAELSVPVAIGDQDGTLLFGSTRNPAGLDAFQLALRAASLSTHGGFDQLICLPLVRDMELMDHQLRTVKTVLRRFRGRAMLCDEVGLGKTIEAGITLSELHVRGLVRSVLILTPPSLVEQWQGEMRRKFSLDMTAFDSTPFRAAGRDAWSRFDHVIVSMHTAKREPHRAAILARKWDMVIIDEAHHLRNRNTQLWKFASELQKQYVLLLTATPVQNNLNELFNLVTLLEPGLLSTSKQFQKRFVDRNDKLTPRNVDQLHSLLSEVMVRNRRSTTGLQFTRRWARTQRVPLERDERQLYDQVTGFVREALRSEQKRAGLNRMVLLMLQMALGSSPAAAAGTLQRLADQPRLPDHDRARLAALAQQAGAMRQSAKSAALIELVREFQDKMVIFTQFRATQQMLSERLDAAGNKVAVFHGGLSRMEKEAAIEQFRGPARLLLCTEAGSEGRNLQFAHAVCNFDLPWNPMKIEQRIGRLSRIGQTHDVHVFNLVAAGTVEDALLNLLDAKLSMFELVIGEIDMILGNLDEDKEFQDLVADLWVDSTDDDDFHIRMEQLGTRLINAKQAYLDQRQCDDRLFGERFAPDR